MLIKRFLVESVSVAIERNVELQCRRICEANEKWTHQERQDINVRKGSATEVDEDLVEAQTAHEWQEYRPGGTFMSWFSEK